MEERWGRVVRIENGLAVIIPEKIELCQECSLCGKNKANELRARNFIGAEKGDLVSFEIDIDRLNFRLIGFLGCGLLLLLLGVFGGYYLAPIFHIDRYLFSISGALLALVITFFLFRSKRKEEDCLARVVRIIKSEEEEQ